jgi:biopolymer transport protein TolQ
LASLLSWVVIFRLSARLGSAKSFDEQFETWFWSGEDLAKLYQGVQGSPDRQGLEQIFYVGFSEYLRMHKKRQPKDDIIDGVERKLRVGLGRQQQLLESGLTTLASIGSVAPYVGLFGTVWGIMNAFLGLSQTEQATLASVAPGIAEALIATAMGLFAAIPAVLAFNHFTAKSARLYESRALFCDEMTGMLQRETSIESKIATPRTAHINQSNPL